METLNLAGNPNPDRDWARVTSKATKEDYIYTVAHWAATEARFRRHFRKVADTAGLVHLDDLLILVTQNDVVQRHVFDENNPSYVPDFGVYIHLDNGDAGLATMTLSRHMVLFCVERRKAWRVLQSRAGVQNLDYSAQKAVLAALMEVNPEDRFGFAVQRFTEELATLSG